eukprot:gene430-455_t
MIHVEALEPLDRQVAAPAGQRGSGKSFALYQAVLHARKRGWLCLYIPDGWAHAHEGEYIEPCHAFHPADPALFDNVFMSIRLVRSFLRAHADKLRSLPIQMPDKLKKYQARMDQFRDAFDRMRKISSNRSEGFLVIRAAIEDEDNIPSEDDLDKPFLKNFNLETFQAKTLEDILLLALAFRDMAGSLVMDLVEELKLVKSVPVLIAIDQYNSWSDVSGYHYDMEAVQAYDLCVPRALRPIREKKAETLNWRLENGIVMCALSFHHPQGRRYNFENSVPSVPVVVRVPVFSQREFFSTVMYYLHKNRIDPAVSTNEIVAFRTFTGSLGTELRKRLVQYFAPLAFNKIGQSIDDMLLAEANGESGSLMSEKRPDGTSYFEEVEGEDGGYGNDEGEENVEE